MGGGNGPTLRWEVKEIPLRLIVFSQSQKSSFNDRKRGCGAFYMLGCSNSVPTRKTSSYKGSLQPSRLVSAELEIRNDCLEKGCRAGLGKLEFLASI